MNLAILAKQGSVNIQGFHADGMHGGSISGILNVDLNYTPSLSGNIVINDLYIKFDELDDIINSDVKLIGNSVVNGRLKFLGEQFDQIDDINGELSFIKAERVQLNKINASEGIYLTLSNNVRNKNTVFVNDIYGHLTVKNNIMSFKPVFLVYLDNNVEHRGTFHGTFNLLNMSLLAQGKLDRISDINKKIEFNLEGLLGNVDIDINRIQEKQNVQAVATQPVKDILERNAKSHQALNSLNDTKNPDHFNNQYNMSDLKKSDQINNLYQQSLQGVSD